MNNQQPKQRQKKTALKSKDASADLGLRVPPQAIETEMSVLGAMVIDKECIGDVVQSGLVASNFYRQDHQLIFEAVVALYDANKPVDLVLLRDELRNRGQLEQVGGVDYLVSLAESVPSAANAEHYATIVREKSMLRDLITVSSEISTAAFEATTDVKALLDEAEQKIFQVTEQKITGQAHAMHDIISNVYKTLDNRDGQIQGLPTGFFELDEITSGLQKGEMIIIAARPSMGKTALGLNIAEYVGTDNNTAVAVFSLEMAAQQLVERMLAGRAHVDAQALRKGMLTDSDYNKLHDAASQLTGAPIFVDDTPSLTPLELRAKARRLKMQHDIQLIVIDYLQLMYCPGAESRQMEVGTISRHVKALGRELNVPIIIMSQLNRGPEGRDNHRPRMSDLRESGNIEQDADVVMLLHREDYFHRGEPDYEPTNSAEIIIAKQRNGPTGVVELTWQGQFTRFENLSHAPDYGI